MTNYEIRFGHTDFLSGKYVIEWDYVDAKNERDAINRMCWKHGEVIDIIFARPYIFEDNE